MANGRSIFYVIAAIQEISNSQQEAIRHPLIAAEVQMAQCRMFSFHHPVAIDFQLPKDKSVDTENRQEKYNNAFRGCR